MPNTTVTLAPGVSWVGALNPNLRVFDIIMRTERGTTYNAYLVQGRDKTALIDGVKAGFSQEWLDRLESLVPLDRIDYLVGNHLEPDHSGAYLAALERMPRARVVVSKNARTFLQELTNQDLDPLLVGTGDSLDLGGQDPPVHYRAVPALAGHHVHLSARGQRVVFMRFFRRAFLPRSAVR
ncbi:MAG: hypothetical protein AB1439_06180 [candidate division FCPU426 bacterium]